MRHNTAIVACALVMLSPTLNAQTFTYSITSRVDTTNPDVKNVLATWIGYLGSRPDSAYDNPYWNAKEKALYGLDDFDFAGFFLFSQVPATYLVTKFKPTVLSIEKVDDHFEIRTLFYGENLEPEMAGTNPLTMLRVAAIREDGVWKLANMLPFATRDWNERRVGPIRYMTSPRYQFNDLRAQDARRFVDSVATMFGTSVEPFSYYLVSSADEVGELLGHDFFFVGYTTGLNVSDNRIILAGFDSENYPHEFVHLVVGKVDNQMISEGLATWIGGSGNRTFEQNVASLRECLNAGDSVTIEQIVRGEWGWHCNAFYTAGAMIVALVHRRGGIDAVKRLLKAPEDDEQFLQFVADALGVRRQELNEHVWHAVNSASR